MVKKCNIFIQYVAFYGGFGNKEVTMLKLTLHPGDFIDIGQDIKVVFSGGSANNIHLLIDAPRDLNIVRSTAAKNRRPSPYRPEQGISPEAQREIVNIIKREKSSRHKMAQAQAQSGS